MHVECLYSIGNIHVFIVLEITCRDEFCYEIQHFKLFYFLLRLIVEFHCAYAKMSELTKNKTSIYASLTMKNYLTK